MTTPLVVRTISVAEHLAFLQGQESVSFLQTPAWARVKREWKAESIGWSLPGSPAGELVGVALVLYRQLPRFKRYLAYLPEGPVIDWDTEDLSAWLSPMAAHLKARGAFGIRIENLVMVQEAGNLSTGAKALKFETLTVVPIDKRMIDVKLMTHEEIKWLDDYHARVAQLLMPYMDADERTWLQQATSPLKKIRAAGPRLNQAPWPFPKSPSL